MVSQKIMHALYCTEFSADQNKNEDLAFCVGKYLNPLLLISEGTQEAFGNIKKAFLFDDKADADIWLKMIERSEEYTGLRFTIKQVLVTLELV